MNGPVATASCAAMALTVGSYVWPGQTRAVAVAAVTAVNYGGVQKSAWLTRAIVAAVLSVLTAVVVAALTSGTADAARLGVGSDAAVSGVLQVGVLLESANGAGAGGRGAEHRLQGSGAQPSHQR